MTLEKLYKLLERTGFSVHYSHSRDERIPPYIKFGLTNDSDVLADNRHYFNIDNGFIELYTDKKDVKAEQKLLRLLIQKEIPYSKEYETYLNEENIFLVRWNIQLIGGYDGRKK